jgi:hypothetical protein
VGVALTSDFEHECFFVTRIGREDSPEREQADGVLGAILEPAATELGLVVVRADHIAESGQITTQIIEHLLKAKVVVADVTGGNPNVYYELGVRQTLARPAVLMAQEGESLPFDTSQMRTIFYIPNNFKSAAEARRLLKAHLDNALDAPGESPVSAAVDLETLREGGAVERQLAEVVRTVETLARETAEVRMVLEEGPARGSVSDRALRDLAEVSERLQAGMAGDDDALDLDHVAALAERVNSYLQRRLGRGTSGFRRYSPRRSTEPPEGMGREDWAEERSRRPGFRIAYTIASQRLHISLLCPESATGMYVCLVQRPDGTTSLTRPLGPIVEAAEGPESRHIEVVYPDDFDATDTLLPGRYEIQWLPQPTRSAASPIIATAPVAQTTLWVQPSSSSQRADAP